MDLILLAAAAAQVIVSNDPMGPTLRIISNRDQVPIGYRRAIRGYWNRQYGQSELIRTFYAIDGGKVYQEVTSEMKDEGKIED